MVWGSAYDGTDVPKSQEAYVEEVVLFLHACTDRSPALLWPEQEPAVPDTTDRTSPAFDRRLSAYLARSLTSALGVPVTETSGTPLDGPATTHTLVVQTAGRSHWAVATAQEPERPLVLPLLTSEVLYLPRGSRTTVTASAGSRLVSLSLGTPAHGRGLDREPFRAARRPE
ncbi:hypothetical protein [Streptomyces malaysiense]|uniref:Uncharacterized protein n=1 Tax=Streptomyces malaysiense TaxID=1428626 RepID=A0A1J4Q0Y1_9ACTN|nr:hypothetical protein [Streptomyces malaysiense]OIK26070.1 hypothetical protein VT52_018560 [Streptomyces malaysiense]